MRERKKNKNKDENVPVLAAGTREGGLLFFGEIFLTLVFFAQQQTTTPKVCIS